MSGCGECTACCTLMEVTEIRKPRCKACGYLDGKGCGIYESRPQSCREFECIWLQSQKRDEPWPKRMRPDKCGIMFVPTTDPNTMTAHGPRALLTGSFLHPRVKIWLSNGLRIISADGDNIAMLRWKK